MFFKKSFKEFKKNKKRTKKKIKKNFDDVVLTFDNHCNQQCDGKKSKIILTNFLKFVKNEHRSLITNSDLRKAEFRRKIFHLIGFIFPFASIFGEQKMILLCTILFIVPFIVIDYNNWLIFLKKIPRGTILIQLLRQHELIHGQLCGVSWLFLGFIVTYSSCDKYLVSLSMSILIVCDACAAIIGCNYGRIKICGKSLEGYIAFISTGIIVIAVYIKYIIPIGIDVMQFNILFLVISLVVTATAELVAKNIMVDDNFIIQIAFCFTYKVLSVLFV